MKAIIVTISLIVATYSPSALAKGLTDNESHPATQGLLAELETFAIGHEYLSHVDYGTVSIDLKKSEITLTLHEPWSCPDGLVCVMVMPHPHIIKLPIISVFKDWCGSTTYIAERDKTPVDGHLEIIEVNDYSTLECRIAVPYQTKVQYRTLNPWLNQWNHSNFNAGQLVPFVTPFPSNPSH